MDSPGNSESLRAVTVIDARGDAPVLSDAVDGLFQRNVNTGVLSTSAVAIRPNYAQPDAPGLAYIGSSGEDRIQTAVVVADYYDQAKLLAADYFFVHGVGSNSGGGADTRGLAFDSHQRMYLVGRAPASVLQYDVSLDETGQPRRAMLSGAGELPPRRTGPDRPTPASRVPARHSRRPGRSGRRPYPSRHPPC